MNPFQSRRAALVLTFIISVGLIVLSRGADAWWGNLLQNLGSGLLTSLFLIGIYDRILEQRLVAEAKARERTALRKLQEATKHHVRGVLFSIYRSSVPDKPSPIPTTYRDLVASHFAAQAAHLNLLAASDVSHPVHIAFGDWIPQNVEAFQGHLQRWLTTYGLSVRPEIGNAVEALLESDFMRVASQLDRLKVQVQAAGLTSVNFFSEQVCQSYADRLCLVIDFIEGSVKAPLGTFSDADWHNQFFAVGHARMPNVDLRP